MKGCRKHLLLAALLWLALPAARAAITCTGISSPGATIYYVNQTTASVQTYFTVSCTRGSSSDPTSVAYSVRAGNGLFPNGQNNNARLNGTMLRYEFATDAACSNAWNNPRTIADAITWAPSATGAVTRQTSFWGCVTNPQTAAASGTYQDLVTLTLTYGNNQTQNGFALVRIIAPSVCSLTQPAGNITLGYAAFGPQVVGTTTFRVTCTNGMPYTLSTDVTEAVVTGVRYLLGLSSATANGSGAAQSYTITATAPAGQAGACATGACIGFKTHTLTVAY